MISLNQAECRALWCALTSVLVEVSRALTPFEKMCEGIADRLADAYQGHGELPEQWRWTADFTQRELEVIDSVLIVFSEDICYKERLREDAYKLSQTLHRMLWTS